MENQLYYLVSPADDGTVFKSFRDGSGFEWAVIPEDKNERYMCQFLQVEIDVMQNLLSPELNLESLKVRVEDFGNGQDN